MAEGYDYINHRRGQRGNATGGAPSEEPAATVCLLEAGGRDRNPLYHLPARLPRRMNARASAPGAGKPCRSATCRAAVFTTPKPRSWVRFRESTGAVYTRANALGLRRVGGSGAAETAGATRMCCRNFRKAEEQRTRSTTATHAKGGPWAVSRHNRAAADLRGVFRKPPPALGMSRISNVTGETPGTASPTTS